MNVQDRPDNLAGFLANISMALDGIDYSLGALVAMARFQIMSETGVDPLENTIYQTTDSTPKLGNPERRNRWTRRLRSWPSIWLG